MSFLSLEIIRSFIAIDLENQIIDRVAGFQKTLVNTGADLKLVEAQNIHITLRFLGEVPLSLIEEIRDKLKILQFNQLEVSIQGIGVFPDVRHFNIIWVGIEKGVLQLIEIHSKIEAMLKHLGVRPDGRGFSPHVTVARVRSAKNKDRLIDLIIRGRDQDFGTFRVDSIKLKRSVLTPGGPIYTTLIEAKAAEYRT